MSAAPSQRREVTAQTDTSALLFGIFGVGGFVIVLWVGGQAAALLTGHHPKHRPALVSGLQALAHPGDPSRAWRQPMPAAGAYWAVTGLVILVAMATVVVAVTVVRRAAHRHRADVHNLAGLASRGEAKAAVSSSTLLRRAAILRPSLPKPAARDVGFRLGTCRGVEAWTSVEDSLVVLGPPRSGKGLHIVIPMISDAPGPVLTTSTRGDNVAATLAARRARGDVAVFDPQALAPGIDAPIGWSPIRGCRDPHTAMIRARALAAGSANHVDNGGFWQSQTESALRAFLHAAALDGRDAHELYRWSLSPAAAGEAVRILNVTSHAAAGWADGLDAIVHADPRTRDNSWAGIRTALACLANPDVLAAVTPRAGHQLDPEDFLAGNGTLYLLGTASGVGPAANLVAALVEDIVDVARRIAADSPSVRLDPPLALILDESANYTLPSLPALISEGGGTGITTVAVLQSLAQARARWGEHDGAAIWDAASVKIILGGGSNARDLADLASLIGERDDETGSATWDPRGGRSYTTNIRRVPVLDAGRLRTLPFGTAVLLLRSAPPMLLDLPHRRLEPIGAAPSSN